MSTQNALVRFARLLALVPFLQTHQGIAINEAAESMGITERELISDLHLMWMCGLPGYTHLELIDLDFESGHISIENADTLAKPLSLTSDEAIALSMGLSLLGALPNVELNEDLRSAQAKIQAGVQRASEMAQLKRQVLVVSARPTSQNTAHLKTIESAILRGEQVEIEYYVSSRDEMTSRTIEPMLLRLIDGISYVEAWCLQAEDRRLFRLDRIYGAVPLSTARSHELGSVAAFNEELELPEYQISLAPSGRWIIERYGAKALSEADPSGFAATLAVGDRNWLLRLALSAGGDLVVTSDADLQDEIRATARLALANYEEE